MRVNSGRPPDRALPDLVLPASFLTDDMAGDDMAGGAVPAESVVASDAEVIRLSLRDQERFAEIFHRYFAAIHRYASARLGADAADDVAADTFLAAFRQRERYDLSRRDARAWLFGIATNLIRRHRRDEVRLYRALERARDASAVGADSADAYLVVEAQRRLAGALAVLKAGDREALLLVAYGELSYAEVSDALGIPPGTVGSRLNRARRRVREVLNTDAAGKGDRHDG
ncbi:RNA polymerase sigma factor [Streptosporangium sp. NPDC023963]|uniref:RNA polymerase sigma factor n=1 Tax=Streptosporangium sp. NPDC023963 TaxID=3155608 RepID=UPI00342CF862